MRKYLLVILIGQILTSCTCDQQASGIVLDKQTGQPLSGVYFGKYEKEKGDNPYFVRDSNKSDGQFSYHSITDNYGYCPDVELYFNKIGYRPAKMIFEPFSQTDTVFLEKINFNRDSSSVISRSDFNNLIKNCIALLQTKQLKNITDEEHIQIMICLNTIFMRQMNEDLYQHFEKITREKNYSRDIINVYPQWFPNLGMGFYFPKLKMELYGTPSPNSLYNVTD
ncbi:MAG: hypothetical protein ABI480_09980 [Chitinophagaceae bacterium]